MFSKSIYCDDKVVGTASFQEEGLLFKITCKCCMPPDQKYEIWLYSEDNVCTLGLCVHTEGGMGLTKRVHRTKINPEQTRLCIKLRQDTKKIPIDPSESFPYLEHLGQIHLIRSNGMVYLQID